MNDPGTPDGGDPSAGKTAAEKLAELVQRKTQTTRSRGGAKAPGVGSGERAASARAASQAKPAPRKG